ncbi:CheR family methyltransferase [Sphingosinicella humi]|uniref:Chemotaxis protein CheR n=1 Tax=Allosphingosinicella humi TaxID=2068657 RepID=A0A2U2IZ27_9SPHN|nr:protein-glutamate O-methyltransferase CheR [Sphingosinicella humi]PWG01317.1 chemotaxis protein CheR [Sphingosinicella humi]
MEVSDASSRILAGLLETRTGQQLTISRRWRIETALKSILRERGIGTLDQLIATLVTGREPGLADEVVEALLNNETYFYRDRSPFDLLLNGALRRLERMRAAEKKLSIWCAGCSTGQEVYSLAMAFAEDKVRWRDWTIDIVGTDVSRSAIERARSGLYSQFEVQRGLPVLQMIRWFDEEEGQQWRIMPQIRDSVRFQHHSLVEPPPRPGRFDVILCRNVLLYFSAERRRTVFDKLAAASAPDAILMLGAGETVIGQTEAFVSDPSHRGLYMRREEVPAVEPRRVANG